ncbi:hypothetical protein CYMTET_52040 [Cymbomonas tetramitiformis]|uniref:Spermidine synthase n=1 Tax=Cymbomonas tetramitiformis TaxID=36881 RepID=A0AAE0BL08_9CHLO|nr:hypothetical protein CYMTET_52040 [Cymbomonas tetramitiformis]
MTANLQLCTHKSACLRRLKCSPPTAPLSRRASENSANTAFRAFVPTPRISFRGKHICRNGGSFFEDQDLSASEEKEIPPPEPVLPPGVLFMEGNENNIIRVVDIPVDAGIALAGARLLMLDHTNNVHSIYQPSSETLLSTAYWDVMGCLPPLLPAGGTLGWLGLGAGTGAHLINKYFPQQRQEGWELDGTVLEASRKFMGLAELESGDNPLEVHVSNAFEACVEGGFSGLIVDLFTHGRVLPELLEADTWKSLAERCDSCRIT